jgi:DNA-directed RNA polymerase specialized sigma24 family protein
MWGLYCQDHMLSGDGLSDVAVDPVATDKRGLYHTVSTADLDAGLRQLPEALRAALILTDVEGYRLEDLTAIFGWSKPRAQVAVATARRLLNRFLQARLTSVGVSPDAKVKDTP